MHVAIIGGTGFVGSYIVDQLLEDGHEVSQLVRPGSEDKARHSRETRIVAGDIDSADSIADLVRACDALIYCVGILREDRKAGVSFENTQYQGVATSVAAALEAGVGRFLLMSANGVKCPGTRYQETKKRAEDLALESSLQTTVFRPSVIFGDPRGRMEFATQLFRDMIDKPIPAVSFFKGLHPLAGAVVMSPVHVTDVARAFTRALDEPSSIGQVFELGGPEVLSWPEMLRRIATATGRAKWIIPVPINLMRLAASLLDWLPFFPVTRDQLTMLKEGNTADPAVLESLLGKAPLSFSAERLDYLNDEQ